MGVKEDGRQGAILASLSRRSRLKNKAKKNGRENNSRGTFIMITLFSPPLLLLLLGGGGGGGGGGRERNVLFIYFVGVSIEMDVTHRRMGRRLIGGCSVI